MSQRPLSAPPVGPDIAEPEPAANVPSAPPDVTVSNLGYAELVTFFHHQLGRVETTWFRVMYLHAAIVGVLIFFHQSDYPFVVARVVVFGFYTVNMLIFHVALRESYRGLNAVQADLRRFPETDGAVDAWFRSHGHDRKRVVRVLIMVASWALVAFLLSWTFTAQAF